MKKISGILTVSLVAVMAVGAARADLAATTYVDEAVEAATANMEVTTNKVSSTDEVGTKDKTELYPSVKYAEDFARSAAASAIATGINSGTLKNEFAKKQDKSTAAYQVGNADGGWTALTADEQAALKSGATATNIAQIGNKADKSYVDTELGKKQDKLTQAANGSDNVKIDANGKITLSGIATDTAVSGLTTRVGSLEGTVGDSTKGLVKSVADNTKAIADINDDTSGILAQAKSDATTKANTAKTEAIANAKSYADTELAKKQNKLTQAVNGSDNVKIDDATGKITLSGIATNTALTTLEGKVTANTTGVTEAKEAAQAAKDAADAKLSNVTATGTGNVVTAVSVADGVATLNKGITAITKPTVDTPNTNGTYVLTATISNGTATYHWENIGRNK